MFAVRIGTTIGSHRFEPGACQTAPASNISGSNSSGSLLLARSSSECSSSSLFSSASIGSSIISSASYNQSDPVYLEDEQVFYNLILKESSELTRCQEGLRLAAKREMQIKSDQHENDPMMDTDETPIIQEQPLSDELRHPLLSWMLNVCEDQSCQDEIFPLATMILDKFLRLHQQPRRRSISNHQPAAIKLVEVGEQEEEEEQELLCCEDLRHRQLYLFAACALLLATKMRQTPRLYIQALIEFSKSELAIELTREEILDGELLILATLKWDLAGLVTPNDFIPDILGKCRNLSVLANLDRSSSNNNSDTELKIVVDGDNNSSQRQNNIENTNNSQEQQHWSRVIRHTQILLELCLMDSQLSQISPSILAMASMAVAIDGLSMTEKTCWRLENIVTNIHEATHKVNDLKLMIEVSFQIEKYVQKQYVQLNSTNDD